MLHQRQSAPAKAALASALGEYFERLSTNYFFADFYLGRQIAGAYCAPSGMRNGSRSLKTTHCRPASSTNACRLLRSAARAQRWRSGRCDPATPIAACARCRLPSVRPANRVHPDEHHRQPVCFQRMSAGNTANEARVQGLSEVFERYVKRRIIAESISLPVGRSAEPLPGGVVEAIAKLEEEGFPISL
ncbi:YcaO-like family protein [Serratia ureilytica]